MWFCCTFIFIFIGCEITVKGQKTSPASFHREKVISFFSCLQDNVRNLELKYKQVMELTIYLRIVQNITYILQSGLLLAKNSMTFTFGLDLKQQRYNLVREINKTRTKFETKIKAITITISGIIPTGRFCKHVLLLFIQFRRNMAEILPIRRKTLSNQSINHIYKVNAIFLQFKQIMYKYCILLVDRICT